MKISSLTSSPSSRSITQSMTGRPATLRSGLGTRWVWGRRRVPFPASGMITCMSASAVAVLEPDKVVELRRGCFEHVAVDHRFDLVDELGRDVDGLPCLERTGLELGTGTRAQDELAQSSSNPHGLSTRYGTSGTRTSRKVSPMNRAAEI